MASSAGGAGGVPVAAPFGGNESFPEKGAMVEPGRGTSSPGSQSGDPLDRASTHFGRAVDAIGVFRDQVLKRNLPFIGACGTVCTACFISLAFRYMRCSIKLTEDLPLLTALCCLIKQQQDIKIAISQESASIKEHIMALIEQIQESTPQATPPRSGMQRSFSDIGASLVGRFNGE